MTPKRLIFAGIVIIIVTLLIAPSLCITAASEGLLLWFNKVLPSLLPFIILINLLVGLNMLEALSRLLSPLTKKLWGLPGSVGFAFLMGLIAGYPMGAKIIRQLVANQNITIKEGELALCFCNNCGPLFIIGTVGTILLQNTQLGYFLLLIHLLSALFMSFLLTHSMPHVPSKPLSLEYVPKHFQFASAFTNAVQNGMDTIVCVGGYIIFFSVITKILTSSSLFKLCLRLPLINLLPSSITSSLLVGTLELSNGVGMLSTNYLTQPSIYTLATLSACIGFGGFCVYFQTLYVLENISLSTKPYLLSKLLQACLSFLLTCTLYPMFFLYTEGTSPHISLPWLLATLLALLIFNFLIKFYSRYNTISSLATTTIQK